MSAAIWTQPHSPVAVVRRDPALIALGMAVFLAPYLSWRPLDVLFTISDATFVVAALMLALSGRIVASPFAQLTPLWLGGFGLMATGLLLGSLINGDPVRWTIATAQYGFAFVVLPYLLLGRGQAATETLSLCLVYGVAVMELFGICVYHLWDASFEEYRRLGLDFISGSRRLGVFLQDGNWNGAVIAMTIPFVFYLAAAKRVSRWLAVALLVVMAWAAVLAASVSALLCILGGLLVMAVVTGSSRTLLVLSVILAAMLFYAVSGLPLPEAFEARVLPAIAGSSLQNAGTFGGRYQLMQEAWSLVGDYSIVGMGVDQYRQVSVEGAPVHNMYLLLWAEGGLVAVAGWLLMLAVLVAAAALAWPRDRKAAALALSVLASFVIASNASPHMYARMWPVPLLLAIAFATMSQSGQHRLHHRGVKS